MDNIQKTTYNEMIKKAIEKYRNNNLNKYNEYQRDYYHKKKLLPEWKKKFNERCKLNNQKYRESKRTEPPKPRGRPKKPLPFTNISKIIINNLENS